MIKKRYSEVLVSYLENRFTNNQSRAGSLRKFTNTFLKSLAVNKKYSIFKHVKIRPPLINVYYYLIRAVLAKENILLLKDEFNFFFKNTSKLIFEINTSTIKILYPYLYERTNKHIK
jgi:hypothetical protein